MPHLRWVVKIISEKKLETFFKKRIIYLLKKKILISDCYQGKRKLTLVYHTQKTAKRNLIPSNTKFTRKQGAYNGL